MDPDIDLIYRRALEINLLANLRLGQRIGYLLERPIDGRGRRGSVSPEANKMANRISASNRLRKTHVPVNLPSVRDADAA